MRVAFAGTPAFAAIALEAILDAGFEVPIVLTQPDRPAGRGLAAKPGAVKALAISRGLPVLQPASLRSPEAREPFLRENVDVLVVAAYGLILPQEVLDWPRIACLNIHASLLPRWRGAAPIQRALLAGDAETGVCIMKMDAGLDTGPVLRCQATTIDATDTAGSVHDRLARMGAELVVGVLSDIGKGQAPEPRAQPRDGATYADKIVVEESLIDWNRPAREIERLLRAMNPTPGARTTLDGQTLKVWRGVALEGRAAPGSIVEARQASLLVGCGQGILRLDEVQPAGAKRMNAQAFLAGRKLAVGRSLG